jgi:hypothetical protein
MNHDEQAEAVLGYMKIQSQLTLGQQRDYGKLSGSARKYIEETEILTRVTGLNRKEQENIRDRQLSQQRSGAAIEELMDQGKEGAVKLIQQQATVYAKMGPVAEQGYNDILSGNIQTEAAQKLMRATQGKVMQDQIDIIEERITSERDAMAATQETAGVMGQMRKDMGALGKAGVFEEIFIPFKEMGEAAKLKATDLATAVDRARKEVDALTGTTGKTEAVTDRYTDLLISQNEQMLALQRRLHGAFSTAGVGVDGFMDIIKKAAQFMIDMVKQGIDILEEMSTLAVNKLREMLGIEGPTAERLETERQDKANSSQADVMENVVSSPAKLIEAAGDIAALGVGIVSTDAGKAIQNVVDTAKKERVASDTEYLANKESIIAKAEANSKVLGFGPGQKAPQTREDYEELERQRRSPPPAPAAGEPKEQQRQAQAKDTAALVNVNQTLNSQRESLKANTEALSKLDKTRDKAAIESLERLNQTITKRTKELEKEADLLKEKLKQNQPAVSTPSGSTPSGSTPFFSNPFFSNPFGSKQSGSNQSGPNQSGPASVPSIRANQQDLAKSGLIIKKGDVQAPDASISTELLEVAKKIQGGVPGFNYFSGFNDRFHQEEAPNSLHTQGMAADFTLKQRPSRDEGKKLIAELKSLGATKAIDEYNNKSPHATGGHIHVEVAGKGVQAASGGVFDGPKSGYAATLHGREAVIPLKDGAVPVSMSQEFNMTATNLGELVAIMKSNVGMQERMLTVLDEMRRSQSATADNTGKMVTYASN